ncbi:hypothetical protein Q4485_11660 [Granulosicoccaceae sp. 1_MG-2023]|nr:hypothetical protein [Granulosicoccaceae sp. 1_MG-2023]
MKYRLSVIRKIPFSLSLTALLLLQACAEDTGSFSEELANEAAAYQDSGDALLSAGSEPETGAASAGDEDGSDVDADEDLDGDLSVSTVTPGSTGSDNEDADTTDSESDAGSDADSDVVSGGSTSESEPDVDSDSDSDSDSDEDDAVADNSDADVVEEETEEPVVSIPSYSTDTRQSLFSEPVTLPACDAADPDVAFIDDVSDLSMLNDSDKRVFCISPNDYRSFGEITLSADGSSAEPRVLRLYYDGLDDDTPIALVPESERAILPNFILSNADYWLFDRISVVGVSGSDLAMHIDDGSEGTTLNRVDFHDFERGIDIEDGGHNTLIQNSLIGDMRVSGDYVCIGLKGSGDYDKEIRNVKIIGNELYNCNDGIQAIFHPWKGNSADFAGLSIIDNDIYITDELYTDGSGNYTTSGDRACAENAMDLKAGSDDAANPVRVTGNRMWGYRWTDSNCGNGNLGSRGSLISAHYDAHNIIFSDNIFYDAGRGLTFSDTETSGYYANDVIVKDNVFHGMSTDYFSNYSGNAPHALLISGSYTHGFTVEDNVFVDSSMWLYNDADDNSFNCNVVLDGGSVGKMSGSSLSASGNAYFATNALSIDSNPIEYGSVSDAQHEPLCFTRKRQSSPETYCLSNVMPTESSPHNCANNVDDLAG